MVMFAAGYPGLTNLPAPEQEEAKTVEIPPITGRDISAGAATMLIFTIFAWLAVGGLKGL